MLQSFVNPLYERKISHSLREKRQMDVDLEIKSMDAESGRFAGYASVFDVVDSQRDVVEKGAFVRTLRDRVGEIKLLWQHDMSEPIGYFTEMFEDERGLYVEGQLLLKVARAQEALELLQNGVVKGLSIGYAPRHYVMDPDSGVRRLSEVDLFEVSLVTFPANEVAQVSVVKAESIVGSAAFNEIASSALLPRNDGDGNKKERSKRDSALSVSREANSPSRRPEGRSGGNEKQDIHALTQAIEKMEAVFGLQN